MASEVMLRLARHSTVSIRAAQHQSPLALLFWDSACMYAQLRFGVAKPMVVQLQLLDLWDCSPLNKMTTPWQPFYIQMLLSKPPETQALADSMLLLGA